MATASYTLLQLLNIVGFRAGDVPELLTLMNPDRPTSALIESANEVLRLMARVKPALDLQARTSITTVAPYSTGTVEVAKNSAAVIGAGTNWQAVYEGRAIIILGSTMIHRVATVIDSTNMTISPVFSGDTNTAATYTIVQDQYLLPSNFYDFIDITVDGTSSGYLGIRRISELDTFRSIHSPPSTGLPSWATQIQDSTGRYIVLDPFPDREYTISVRHRIMPTRIQYDGDFVPVLDEDVGILISGILAHWKSITSPAQGASEFETWKNAVLPLAIAQDQRTTDEVLRVVPDDVMRNPVGFHEGGRIDWKDR